MRGPGWRVRACSARSACRARVARPPTPRPSPPPTSPTHPPTHPTQSAQREIALWFKPEELVEWEPVRWWSDLLTWRNQVYNVTIRQFATMQTLAPSLHQMGYRCVRGLTWGERERAALRLLPGLGYLLLSSHAPR